MASGSDASKLLLRMPAYEDEWQRPALGQLRWLRDRGGLSVWDSQLDAEAFRSGSGKAARR